jgi:hypothetical protein
MINEIYNRTIIDIMFKRKKGKNEWWNYMHYVCA